MAQLRDKRLGVSATTILGYWSGLILLAPDMDGATLLRTVLLVHTCDAVICGILASNGGRPVLRWTAIGFVAGIWALMALMVLPRRLSPQR